jgi:hypothetical protein
VIIMKKVKYLIITCLSIALLSYGVVAFANGGTSADSVNISHKAETGKFIALENGKIKVSLEDGIETYPLDKSTWVLRDKKKAAIENLMSGDKLEFVFNSSNKVAYIKAYSEVYLKAEAEAAILSASPTPTPTLAPTAAIAVVNPEPSPTVASKVKEDNQTVAEEQEDNKTVSDDKHEVNDDDHEGIVNDHHDSKDNNDQENENEAD